MPKREMYARSRRDEDAPYVRVWVLAYFVLIYIVAVLGVQLFDVLPKEVFHSIGTVLLGGYLAASVTLHRVYRAMSLGQSRVSELCLSQGLANLISIGVLYLAGALYLHSFYDPRGMAVVLAVQTLVSVCWSMLANWNYFQNHRPPRTAIIFRTEENLQQLLASPYFTEKYDVVKLIRDPQGDIRDYFCQLEDCETVFTVGVEVTVSNSIAKFCVERGIKGFFVPHLGHIIMSGAQYMSNFNMPVLRVTRAAGFREYLIVKRLMDVVLSLAALIIVSPIMLITALCIWLEDKGPVFYSQIRLTKDGREFRILKFRSMTVSAEQDGVARLASANDSRITRVGKFIRTCRIDELPQLINILRGDMSIVGPRPERPEIAREYEKTLPEFAMRLQVKAGLTGYAQIYGRYNTAPYTKLQMDMMYIAKMSFLTDLELMLATVKILFLKESTQGVCEGQKTAMTVESVEEPSREECKTAS